MSVLYNVLTIICLFGVFPALTLAFIYLIDEWREYRNMQNMINRWNNSKDEEWEVWNDHDWHPNDDVN